ncbi:MAG: IS66 family transposase [Tissierellia bacterium]|nr:IS66 family transposase [Tissierellia bacterium]
MIILLRKQKFGSSSEKTPKSETCNQLNLFDEAEQEAIPDAEEPAVQRVDGYYRKNSKTKREELLKDLPVEEILCDVPEEERICPQCKSNLVPVGKETVREELEYIPAQLKVIRYVRMTYGCSKCKQKGTPYMVKALTPTSLMNHSLASPTTVAYVMYQKYVNGMPLYRQEKEWEQLGLALSRATMANWIIRCSQDWLMPVVERLRQELLKREVIHCDETPVQVLKEQGKKPQSKSYMWLYRSGADGKPPIVLYNYKPSRSGNNAADYLEGFHGYLHTDGFAGYEKVEGVTRCGCWAHLRRYFVDAIPDKKASGAPPTNAEIGRDYCNKLFEIEKALASLSPDKRKTERLRLGKPVLEAFWCWLDSLTPLKGSRLGKAITYAQNQKPYMENYLLDGRCSISNNIAENSIRPFTVGRKNWLFSDTPKGADASAAVYSIVETAKANNLNIYTYLNYLLLYMPDTDYRKYPETMEDLMPWSERVQNECGK